MYISLLPFSFNLIFLVRKLWLFFVALKIMLSSFSVNLGIKPLFHWVRFKPGIFMLEKSEGPDKENGKPQIENSVPPVLWRLSFSRTNVQLFLVSLILTSNINIRIEIYLPGWGVYHDQSSFCTAVKLHKAIFPHSFSFLKPFVNRYPWVGNFPGFL